MIEARVKNILDQADKLVERSLEKSNPSLDPADIKALARQAVNTAFISLLIERAQQNERK